MVFACVAKGCKKTRQRHTGTQCFPEIHLMWNKDDNALLSWEFIQQHQKSINIWFARSISLHRTTKKNATIYQTDGTV